ncbi:MAG TPA: carbohydrate ABC transporter permease, partial [Paenibacillus sp.]|nr:carbohydrate ABC transporter permease [Paenibacillus sp.]
MVTSSKLRDRLASGFILALLGLAALLCMAPIVNTAAISLSDKAAAAAGWVYFWPVDPTWSSYRTLLSDGQFFASFGISIQRVLLGGAINFVLTVLTAYPLSKETKAFRMRNAIMWFVVFTMLFQGG